MTETVTSQQGPQRRARLRVGPWSAAAVLIAAAVLMPIVAVLGLAFAPKENIWPHLLSTTLPRYMTNTVVLMASVGALSAAVGAGAAWLVTMYRFPLSRWLEWMLLLPLAIPAYVGAYALVDFLEYAGPVQSALRDLFGWTSARDYWFPEIRSRLGAVLVLSGALYPYVYILTRAALREQSGAVYEVARALGCGAWGRFWRVGLPLSRPAIAAGAAIAMMETVADFGVVEYFAVQTLTTGVFSVWLESSNAGGAAQIALVILGIILLLVIMEKLSRRKMRFFNAARSSRAIAQIELGGLAGWAAALACAVPFLGGFVLPAGVLLSHALDANAPWSAPELLEALGSTVFVAGCAAVVTLAAALVLVYGVRLSRSTLPRKLMPVTTIGYAAPGAVLAVGMLIPMAWADNALADFIENLTGHDIGLLMTGSAVAVIYAYAVRFFAIAQGAVDNAMGQVSPSLPMAARSLGRSARGTLTSVYLPLIKGSAGTALLLVFVDCVKELPATLLLRPFGFDTLATRVYEKASLENLSGAAPAALLVSGVGLLAVIALIRTTRK